METSDGDQARVVPAVDDAALHQLLDVALSCHDVGEIELREFDLPRGLFKSALFDDPVIERTMILKLQGADGMCNVFHCVLNGMGKIVHRVDAPLVSRVLVRHMGDAVDDRVAARGFRPDRSLPSFL